MGSNTLPLLAPQKTGGPALFDAINNRSSGAQGNFSTNELSQQDVATLLWAATGLNRDGSKWTVPMGRGVPPYCKVYYADKNGAYLYDWKKHALIAVTGNNIIADTATQDFARKAPGIIYVVEDATEKAKITFDAWRDEFTILLAGAMSQNIYLAAEGIKAQARLVYSVDRDATRKLLKLASDDKVFFAIVLGKV